MSDLSRKILLKQVDDLTTYAIAKRVQQADRFLDLERRSLFYWERGDRFL